MLDIINVERKEGERKKSRGGKPELRSSVESMKAREIFSPRRRNHWLAYPPSLPPPTHSFRVYIIAFLRRYWRIFSPTMNPRRYIVFTIKPGSDATSFEAYSNYYRIWFFCCPSKQKEQRWSRKVTSKDNKRERLKREKRTKLKRGVYCGILSSFVACTVQHLGLYNYTGPGNYPCHNTYVPSIIPWYAE